MPNPFLDLPLRNVGEKKLSISSLANAAAARRTDFVPSDRVPINLSEIAGASAIASVLPELPEHAVPAVPTANAVNTSLNVLFGYIPTEILTLYVAVVAALQNPHKSSETQWIAFWVFLILTPLFLWVIYAAKVMSAGIGIRRHLPGLRSLSPRRYLASLAPLFQRQLVVQ